MAPRPRTISIIRHAEKPDDAGDPHLSERGRKRAAALTRYPFPELAAVFAAKTTQESARPVETVTPLAAALTLPISDGIKHKEVASLAEGMLSHDYAGKHLLACWHHEEIPDLLKALGVNLTRDYQWADVYDRIWVLTYLIDGTPSFEDRPQRLLPGDSPT